MNTIIDRSQLAPLYVRREALNARAIMLAHEAATKLDTLNKIEAHKTSTDPRWRLKRDDARRDYEAARDALSEIDQELGDVNDEIERRERELRTAAATSVKATLRAKAERLDNALAEAKAAQDDIDAYAWEVEATFGEASTSGHISLGELGNEPYLAVASAMRDALRENRTASPLVRFRRALRACGWR
jgi:hypothetical protein